MLQSEILLSGYTNLHATSPIWLEIMPLDEEEVLRAECPVLNNVKNVVDDLTYCELAFCSFGSGVFLHFTAESECRDNRLELFKLTLDDGTIALKVLSTNQNSVEPFLVVFPACVSAPKKWEYSMLIGSDYNGLSKESFQILNKVGISN